MVQRIEIEGELVRVIDVNVLQSARLEDVLPHIENRPPVSMFHPRTAIYTHWDESDPTNKQVKYLLELAPGVRSIIKSDRRYRLAFPWTYFVFSFVTPHDVHRGESWRIVDYFVFHAKERVRDLNSRLWTAFLPNVYEDGRICFGTTAPNPAQPLADRVDQYVTDWYQTQFNNDVHGSRTHPLPYNGRLPTGWKLWVDATAERGASSYLDWPEWEMTNSENGVSSFTVREALGIQDANAQRRIIHNMPISGDRPHTATVLDAIPTITFPMTFGRAEEWLRSLEPTQRYRLQQALNLIVTETPDAVQAPEVDPRDAAMPETDGGEPVTT